jgi:hypothetical protein
MLTELEPELGSAPIKLSALDDSTNFQRNFSTGVSMLSREAVV